MKTETAAVLEALYIQEFYGDDAAFVELTMSVEEIPITGNTNVTAAVETLRDKGLLEISDKAWFEPVEGVFR